MHHMYTFHAAYFKIPHVSDSITSALCGLTKKKKNTKSDRMFALIVTR